MIRKIFSAVLVILLLTGLAGRAAELGAGMIRKLEDNKGGFFRSWGNCGTAS